MGGLVKDKKPNGKDIRIETTSVNPHGNGVLKKSVVRVPAGKQSFVMGVRIGRDQEIDELKFGSYNVLSKPDAETKKALDTALPIPKGVPEQWVAFTIDAKAMPDPQEFQTSFGLSRFPQVGQFQLVPFVMALEPGAFARGAYMVAVSVVTSPSDVGPTELRRS